MRKQEEIKQVISLLEALNTTVAQVQAEVIRRRMDERAVFEKYVIGVVESQRDETLFYAARDAARYMKGEITLDILLPGMEISELSVSTPPDEAGDSITLSREDYDLLLKRLERLEQKVGLRRKPVTRKSPALKPVEMPVKMDMTDMLKQNEACQYLGCSKNTIKRWAVKGLVHAYQKGRYVYYSKKELERVKYLRKETWL
ncbi:helix-turn-helix domain-containing protein [Bacteroides oleiciplenus]|nr:helix-turn-helix domain-containing protein [Bacteroides oleiciplenus]